MTKGKNFSGQVTPSTIDTEYESCNFTQEQPVGVGGNMQGVRLFPGDDTPRTFTRCNMTNCEPPPGSAVTDCNLTVVERNLPGAASETLTIDGESLAVERHINRIHGRFNPDTWTYDYHPVPIDREAD